MWRRAIFVALGHERIDGLHQLVGLGVGRLTHRHAHRLAAGHAAVPSVAGASASR